MSSGAPSTEPKRTPFQLSSEAEPFTPSFLRTPPGPSPGAPTTSVKIPAQQPATTVPSRGQPRRGGRRRGGNRTASSAIDAASLASFVEFVRTMSSSEVELLVDHMPPEIIDIYEQHVRLLIQRRHQASTAAKSHRGRQQAPQSEDSIEVEAILQTLGSISMEELAFVHEFIARDNMPGDEVEMDLEAGGDACALDDTMEVPREHGDAEPVNPQATEDDALNSDEEEWLLEQMLGSQAPPRQ